MTADLELRRQAIAEALRAVMAESFPGRAAPSQPVAAAPEPARPANPPRPTLVVATPAPGPEPIVEPARLVSPRPLREALSAQIDWDEVEELDELDEDWESPSVPPLETAGSMSQTASMALFGHA